MILVETISPPQFSDREMAHVRLSVIDRSLRPSIINRQNVPTVQEKR